MSFRESLTNEIALRQAEVDALSAQLKKAKKVLRDLNIFLAELDKRSNQKESDNEEV